MCVWAWAHFKPTFAGKRVKKSMAMKPPIEI